jgi:hypothetical protein
MTDPAPHAGRTQDDSGREVARWPDWSSGLHESLASHQASAEELRQELDDLRRTLDAAPAGPPVTPRRRGRLVVGGTVLALALGGGLAVREAHSGGGHGSPAGATVPETPTTSPSAVAPPASATSTPTPSSSSALAAAPLPAWPGQRGPEPPDLPAHGVGADVVGTEVTARLADDRRSADVYERALLSSAAATLTLRPAGTADLTRSLRAPMPSVKDLHAEIDGRPVPVLRTASGWTVTAPGGTEGGRLVLRYRLAGALVRPEPAPPGRYTLVLTPVAPSAGDGAAQAVVVRIRDPRVEEVYCPGASNQLCGREDGSLHVGTVPAGAVPLVVALVTFPG